MQWQAIYGHNSGRPRRWSTALNEEGGSGAPRISARAGPPSLPPVPRSCPPAPTGVTLSGERRSERAVVDGEGGQRIPGGVAERIASQGGRCQGSTAGRHHGEGCPHSVAREGGRLHRWQRGRASGVDSRGGPKEVGSVLFGLEVSTALTRVGADCGLYDFRVKPLLSASAPPRRQGVLAQTGCGNSSRWRDRLGSARVSLPCRRGAAAGPGFAPLDPTAAPDFARAELTARPPPPPPRRSHASGSSTRVACGTEPAAMESEEVALAKYAEFVKRLNSRSAS